MDRALFRAHCDFQKYIFIYLQFLKCSKVWTEHYLEHNTKCTKNNYKICNFYSDFLYIIYDNVTICI